MCQMVIVLKETKNPSNFAFSDTTRFSFKGLQSEFFRADLEGLAPCRLSKTGQKRLFWTYVFKIHKLTIC